MSMYNYDRHIVIIGGGIIGCTTAYYLTRHPSFSQERTSVTLIEAGEIAGGASGKAGGLIAKWAFPSELVEVSFQEHERLAKEHGGADRWGWRYLQCGQWQGRGESVSSKVSTRQSKGNGWDWLREEQAPRNSSQGGEGKILPSELDWVREDLTYSYEAMAEEGETAQVHPYQFTTSMLELARERGVKVIRGKVNAMQYSSDGTVNGVTYMDSIDSEHLVQASQVVLSAGPWTPNILPSTPIYGGRAHSITIRPSRPLSAFAIFAAITLPPSSGINSRLRLAQPEVFTRPDGEVYVSSSGDDESLPASTSEVIVEEKLCDELFEQVAAISPELRGGEVTARQACYRPNIKHTYDTPMHPILGEVQGAKGLIVAAGHTCWGICNAPGTGKAVAELVMDGKFSCGDFLKYEPRFAV